MQLNLFFRISLVLEVQLHFLWFICAKDNRSTYFEAFFNEESLDPCTVIFLNAPPVFADSHFSKQFFLSFCLAQNLNF